MAKSQLKDTTVLLGLKGVRVKGVKEEEGRLVVEVKLEGGEGRCPHCGCLALSPHGKGKWREVLHSWIRGKRIYLRLRRPRWRCRGCGRCFSQGLSLLRPYSRLSQHAEAEALWELREGSFARVKRKLGVSYPTLRRLLEREVGGQALHWLEGAEEISLGIDEHSFRHQDMVYTVTEVKRRRVLGILKDDRVATL